MWLFVRIYGSTYLIGSGSFGVVFAVAFFAFMVVMVLVDLGAMFEPMRLIASQSARQACRR